MNKWNKNRFSGLFMQIHPNQNIRVIYKGEILIEKRLVHFTPNEAQSIDENYLPKFSGIKINGDILEIEAENEV